MSAFTSAQKLAGDFARVVEELLREELREICEGLLGEIIGGGEAA